MKVAKVGKVKKVAKTGRVQVIGAKCKAAPPLGFNNGRARPIRGC